MLSPLDVAAMNAGYKNLVVSSKSPRVSCIIWFVLNTINLQFAPSPKWDKYLYRFKFAVLFSTHKHAVPNNLRIIIQDPMSIGLQLFWTTSCHARLTAIPLSNLFLLIRYTVITETEPRGRCCVRRSPIALVNEFKLGNFRFAL